MQFAHSLIRQTHYGTLGVKEDASQEEIRTIYRSALLCSHPDKLQTTSETTNSDKGEPGFRFLEIQKAWEVLGDVKSRAIYDKELQASRQDDLTADEVELEDMMVQDTDDAVELFYQCRCGDYFSFDSLELADIGFQLLRQGNKISIRALKNASMASVVLPCGSCSLKVRLVINQDRQP